MVCGLDLRRICRLPKPKFDSQSKGLIITSQLEQGDDGHYCDCSCHERTREE
ncbi:hypothetical protein EV12_2312 [Prochlorococcus sp. MIT 0701]|nr:hypothetical protein EV12_2312 [Prochlorococcus sp. MIT 0701]